MIFDHQKQWNKKKAETGNEPTRVRIAFILLTHLLNEWLRVSGGWLCGGVVAGRSYYYSILLFDLLVEEGGF